METKIYNLIYAIYTHYIGTDDEFEQPKKEDYEKKAIEMLEGILECLQED